MNLEMLKEALPEYAKDTKLNLSNVLSETDNDSGLTAAQIAGIALASAYTTQQPNAIAAIFAYAKSHLKEVDITAVKAAVSLMAMTNVYYRFTHLVEDTEFTKMPAKLRMNFMANPGVDKNDFELFSLAVSAINGCGMCMDSHNNTLQRHGVSKTAIQHCIRIASVINALSQILALEPLGGE